MSTFKDLVDEVVIRISGYSQRQDQASYLTSPVTSSQTTLTVTDGTVLSRGLAEVGDELVWIDTFDRNTGVATLSPQGRGYRGTTRSSHPVGERVTVSPSFPRDLVSKSVNDAITGVYPDLWGYGQFTTPFIAARTTYQLPADAIDVVAVSWQSVGPTKEWLPIRKWRVDKTADPATFYTGHTLSIYDFVVPGRKINIVYTKQPSPLSLPTDDYTDTGLPQGSKEVVILGAAYRVASYLDAGRLTSWSAETDVLDNQSPIGSGGTVTRNLFALYQQRLQNEVRRQQQQFPVRIHHTR